MPHSALLEWDESDRAKLIAHLLEESGRCSSCGTAEWEWDPKQGGDVYAYEAMPVLCQGCLRKDAARDDEGSSGDGISVRLIPARRAEAIRNAPKRAPGR